MRKEDALLVSAHVIILQGTDLEVRWQSTNQNIAWCAVNPLITGLRAPG